jgi:cold shock CspA family protein
MDTKTIRGRNDQQAGGHGRYRSLEESQRVEFEITQGSKDPQAENVRPV